MGKLSKHRKNGDGELQLISHADGERTKNSMLGFISRGLRNTLSWGSYICLSVSPFHSASHSSIMVMAALQEIEIQIVFTAD